MATNTMSLNERERLAARLRTNLKVMHKIRCADLGEPGGIDYYRDGNAYFDGTNIHIGYGNGIMDTLRVKTPEEFASCSHMLSMHEEGHLRFTAQDVYKTGILYGCEKVATEIYFQREGSRRTPFRKNSIKNGMDWADYLDSTNEYSSNALFKLMSSLQNAVEDGRIERTQADRDDTFANERVTFRGRFWDDTDNFIPAEKLLSEPGEFYRVMFNEILILSTCFVHAKGLEKAYKGTPVWDTVEELNPIIASGVFSSSTQGMVEAVSGKPARGGEPAKKGIIDVLMPSIIASIKTDGKDRQAMERLLAAIIKNIVENIPDITEADDMMNTGTDASTEDSTEPESEGCPFGMSDLEITLPDDVYDKIAKKSKGNGKKGRLTIKREHPLTPDEDEQEKMDSSNGSPDSGEENGGSSQNGRSDGVSNGESVQNPSTGSTGASSSDPREASENEQSGSAENNGSESSSDGKSLSSPDSSNGSESSASESWNSSSEGETGTSNSMGMEGKSETSHADKMKGGKSERKSSDEAEEAGRNISDSEMKDIEKAVKEHMRNAENNLTGSEILKSAAESRKLAVKQDTRKEKKDTSKPISSKAMKDICRFVEYHHEYPIDQPLPVEVRSQGRALYLQNKRYFTGRKTPNISFLDEGAIDPNRLAGLAMGETDIFCREGKDKDFDGRAYILIDNSGSMAGAKRNRACLAAGIIEEGFKGLLPFKIVAFDYQSSVVHRVVKNWDEATNRNLCWNFCVHGDEGCGNVDGYDIKIAARELCSFPEQKKLLIVLSDGTPSDTAMCKGAIEEARGKGITVIGIYFEEGSIGYDANDFKEMYQRDYICCEDRAIAKHLVNIFMKWTR